MAAPPRWPPASSAPIPKTSCSPTRATVTWPPIGMAETVHAATRGENITVIFINNAIYGMTGGQMAPTTPAGRGDADERPTAAMSSTAGYPIRVCECF